jgi:hypothetical protein
VPGIVFHVKVQAIVFGVKAPANVVNVADY